MPIYGAAKGDKRMGKVLLLALLEAGANAQGARDAYQVNFGPLA